MAKKKAVNQKAAKSKRAPAIERKIPGARTPRETTVLRERAEGLIRTAGSDVAEMATEDVQRLIHELQVHQIELEMQNENLRDAQVEIEQSRERFSDLYDFAPVGFLTLTRSDEIVEANLTAAKILGVDRADLVNTRFTNLIGRDNQSRWHRHRDAAFSSDTTQRGELCLVRANASPLWLGLESIVLGSDAGGQRGRQCRTALIDITAAKLARETTKLKDKLQQQVTKQTSELRLLAQSVASLGEGVMITSDDVNWPDPQIIFVNEAMSQISGYSFAELIGQTPKILHGEQTDRQVLGGLQADLQAERSGRAQLTQYRKDGTVYDAELFITPLFGSEHDRTNFVCIHGDVSERKQAEEAIRQSEAFADSILGALLAHIAVVDEHGDIIAVNPAWEQFARENDGVLVRCGIGANYLDVCRAARTPLGEEAGAALSGIQSVMNGSLSTFSLEYPCHSPNRQRWLLMNVTPLANARSGAVVSHIDITARKNAEEALREAHDFSDRLINTARTIVLVLDTEGRIVQLNPYLEELSGWQLADVQGRDWFDTFLPVEDRRRIRELFSKSLQSLPSESKHGNVNPIVTKDGQRREIEWYDTPLTDGDGELIGLLCTGQDITARIQAEAMQTSMGRILDGSRNEIYIFDAQSLKYRQVNRGARRNLGYSVEEICELTPLDLKPDMSREELMGMLQTLRTAEAETVVFEARHRRKDGSLYDVEVHLQYADYKGEPCFVAVIVDTTERHETEQQLRIKDKAIASSAAGIVITDPGGIITYTNPAFAKMWGFNETDQVIGRPNAEFSSSSQDVGEVMEGLRNQGSWLGERTARKIDGTEFDVQVAASVVPDDDGNIICMMASFIDISERKELQRQIVEIAQEEDRRIGQELHDNIQQQLTGVGLLTSELQRILDEKADPDASLANRISQELSKTNEQVHLLSRGLVPVEVDAQGLRSALAELANRVDQQYGVRCSFHFEGFIELADNFAATHLYRMAQEAINNALKHGKPNRIDLSLTGTDGSIRLDVRDNGTGIEREQMDARHGIGLPIMRYRADMIGAKLEIGPSAGKGTLVSCTIPTGTSNTAAPLD